MNEESNKHTEMSRFYQRIEKEEEELNEFNRAQISEHHMGKYATNQG